MHQAEQTWVTILGLVGLVGFVAGSATARPPSIDQPIDQAIADLAGRRMQVIAGSVGALAGAALLLWPLSAVATASGPEVWRSLAAFSMAAWVFGFAFLGLASVLLIGVVWRTDVDPGSAVARLFLDMSHLAVWSISGPVAAFAVAATTVVGVQAKLFGPLVVVAAVVKAATVVVEIAGIGIQRGWNAGGWAYGTSGYATVAWFALVLFALG